MSEPEDNNQGPVRLPMLPLKEAVVFPRMVVPLLVGRAASMQAVDVALTEQCPLFLCAQKDPQVEQPRREPQ